MIVPISEIAADLKMTKEEVQEDLNNGLRKMWIAMEDFHWGTSAYERMHMLGRMLGVDDDEEWPHFFYGFPEDIRLEVLESIKKTEPGFKHLDVNKWKDKELNEHDLH